MGNLLLSNDRKVKYFWKVFWVNVKYWTSKVPEICYKILSLQIILKQVINIILKKNVYHVCVSIDNNYLQELSVSM